MNITKPLTDTEIRLAKPKEKEYNLADDKGLCLPVKPIGSKLWIFNEVFGSDFGANLPS